MSQKRQDTPSANELIERSRNKLVVREILMQAGEHDKPHKHPWHQLLLPRNGVLRTRASNTQYYIPSNRAALIPAGCVHESWAITDVKFIGIYVEPTELKGLAEQCCIVELSPFYKQLVYQIVKIASSNPSLSEKEQRLIKVFCDETTEQQPLALDLIIPQDKRLQDIVHSLLNEPGLNTSLVQWANKVGASERTISRLFEKQTGLSFSRWRRKMRLINSLSYIEQNMPIQNVAYKVGYDSPSAFTHCFKKEFGLTPQQYFL
jgi:AraC-like DNA-binding protein